MKIEYEELVCLKCSRRYCDRPFGDSVEGNDGQQSVLAYVKTRSLYDGCNYKYEVK